MAIHGIDGAPLLPDDVPDLATWRLVEALSLLCIILRSNDAKAHAINLFAKTGPIEIQEDGVRNYLWTQQTLKGEQSGLRGRPDIIVTSSTEPPCASNAVRIIEVKSCRQVGTQTIRSEFGKAYDLRVTDYFIWSFYTPSPVVIAGALSLGINLEPLGFDSERRGDLLGSPDALISHVSHSQERSRLARRFALALETAGQEVKLKMGELLG